MELSGYLSIARRWWWTLLIATWVAGLAGYVVASGLPRTYEAEARLLVGPINTDLNTQRAAGQLAQTYAELITSQPILERVIKELSLSLDAAKLQGSVSANPNDITRLVTIRVQLDDPDLAAQIANSLAQELAELASGTAGLARPEGEVQVIDFADPPTVPVAPQVSLIVILAASAGLLGAIVIILLIEYLSATVRSADEVERLTEAPHLGAIPVASDTPDATEALLATSLPASRLADAYRMLTTKIEFGRTGPSLRSLLVVGTVASDGSGLVATNLAAAFSAAGRRVAFVDGNLDDPQATIALGLRDQAGLTDHLAGEPLTPIVGEMRGGIEALFVGRGSASGDVTSPEVTRAVLDHLVRDADVVVVAGEPIQRSASALLWARAVDATVLVVARDLARREDVRAAADSLRLLGVTLVGTILTEPRSAEARRPIRRARRVLSGPEVTGPAGAASEPAPFSPAPRPDPRPASSSGTRVRRPPRANARPLTGGPGDDGPNPRDR